MGVDGPTMPLFTEQEQALRDELRKIEDEVDSISLGYDEGALLASTPGCNLFKEEVMDLFEQAARLLYLHNRAAEIHVGRARMQHKPPPPEFI